MTHNDRSSRSRRRERRSSEDDTQSISLSEVNDYYTASRAHFIQGLDVISQIVYPPQEQSYPQSSNDYYSVTGNSTYYPTTAPGYSGHVGANDGYASSIATSSIVSAPVSDGWDTQSSAVASSIATTAPARYNMNDINFPVNTQATTTQRYELPCEIRGCDVVYHGDEEDEWIRHTESHLGGTFPSKLRCWFNCPFSSGLFDAASQEVGGNKRNNFEDRMRHIRYHIIHEGYQPSARVDDGFLIEHLRNQGILDEQSHQDWLRPSRLPSIVSSERTGSEISRGHEGSSSRYHQRSGHSYLTVVEEEAIPSSSKDRRHEKRSDKKEHRRDSHSRRKSTK